MQFIINPMINGKKVRLYVNLIKTTKHFEYFQIQGNDRTIVLSNNRPMLKQKGLKTFPIHWELVEGEMTSRVVFEKITEAILEEINGDK